MANAFIEEKTRQEETANADSQTKMRVNEIKKSRPMRQWAIDITLNSIHQSETRVGLTLSTKI
jgi:hypothetical protein